MEEVKKGSYLKSVGLAIVFGLIGVVAWVIIGAYASFISAWIAFGIAYGIRFGYDKGNAPKKSRAIIIIAIYLVEVFISIYLMYYLIMLSVVPINFFDVIPILLQPEMQTSEIISEYVLVAIFSVIGLAFLFINDFIAKRNQKINSGEATGISGTRFTKTINFSGNYEEKSARINELLEQNKFEKQNYGDEQVYRNGKGIWAASKFVKFSKTTDGILIEAFMLINQKECGLEGFYGFAVKKSLKNLVDQIIALIEGK